MWTEWVKCSKVLFIGSLDVPSTSYKEGKVGKMEIERINEHTVKFYMSYGDIEDRGFDREEIWYNRERSEELFWEVMDEVHDEEEFAVEGPLWIQVQALDKGLEIIVTKAQLSKDGQKLELPIPEDKNKSRQMKISMLYLMISRKKSRPRAGKIRSKSFSSLCGSMILRISSRYQN